MDATKSNFFLVVLVDMIGFLAGHAYGCSTETKCSASYSDYESLAFAAGGAFQSAPYAYSYSFPCEVILTICLLLHFDLSGS
jgi:hypothetical protein